MATSTDQPESMRDILNTPLNRFQTLTYNLFNSLSQGPQAKSIPPPTIDEFLECDAALAAAYHLSRKHQIKQKEIESLKSEIIDLELTIRDICTRLQSDKQDLEAIIKEGEERIKIIEKTEKAAVPFDYILAYGSTLAPSTSAPHTDTHPHQDQQAPPAFRPPYPSDAVLRRGRLGSLPGRLHEVTGITRNVGEPPESPIGPPKAKAPETRPAAGPSHRHHRPPPTAQDLFDLDLNPDF